MFKFAMVGALLCLLWGNPVIQASPIPSSLVESFGKNIFGSPLVQHAFLPKIWHIELYPNPAQEWIRITLDSPIEGPVEVTLIDVRGIHLRKIVHFFETGPLLMARNGAEKGTYFLKFRSRQHMTLAHFTFGTLPQNI